MNNTHRGLLAVIFCLLAVLLVVHTWPREAEHSFRTENGISQQGVIPTGSVVGSDEVRVPKPEHQRGTVFVSTTLFDALDEWQNGAKNDAVPLETFLENSPDAVKHWTETVGKETNVTTPDLASVQPDKFNEWQLENLPSHLQLDEFIESQYPVIFQAWKSMGSSTSGNMCFYEFLVGRYGGDVALLAEAQEYYQMTTGTSMPLEDLCQQRKLRIRENQLVLADTEAIRLPLRPVGTTPQTNPCRCNHVVSFPDNPATFQRSTDPSVESDSADKKDQWWEEEWKASHYGELYAHVKKEGHLTSFDIANIRNHDNFGGIRYKLNCIDNFLNECAVCHARLDQYAHYGSQVQVHVDGKGALFRKFDGKVAAGDGAKLVTTLQNGQATFFQKAVAISMDAKSEYDGKKVLGVIKNIIGLAVEVVKAVKGGAPDPAKISKYAEETVKNLFGIVKYEGTTGTKSHGLKVTFDSISNSADPTLSIRSNVDYTMKLTSAGNIAFEGKGKWAKTNNSFYGSGFAAALTVKDVVCPSSVDSFPKPLGAWSYSNTFRSPYSGTATFRSNIRDFIQTSVGSSSGLNVSPHEGFWVVP